MADLIDLLAPTGLRPVCTCGVEMVASRNSSGIVYSYCPHCDVPCYLGALCGRCTTQWRSVKL